MFIIASIDKVIKSKFSYNNKATKIELKNTIISLPTKNDQIDYAFMESFIKELETERITKLKSYLLASNLNDYKLTIEENEALINFKEDRIEFAEFKIAKLFDIKNTFSFNKNKLVNGNDYDYVTRTSQNQGILQQTGFVNEKNINSSDVWSLGLLQMDFFYRKNPWYAGQFVRKIIPKVELEQRTVFYFSTLLNKQKKKLLSVLVRDVDKTFLNSKLPLPILENGEIDFVFMETLMTAINKLVIKDVVLYAKEKANA